ncbi:MAG: cytochrome oxidase [Verrucomicrobiales bacterium]|nr:cytochrome oxidase [Verrucomicrobiales bacterium]
MSTGLKRPTLDTVTTINRDGSRHLIHPADAAGRFMLARRLFAVLLLAVYILLPWIPINGSPAVFLDVANRRFHLFGLTFLAQDLWVAFFAVSGAGFILFYLTALFGRLWCGWACPYTVFLEHAVRRVERWIEGDAQSRRRLDAMPWRGMKILRRGLSLTATFLISLLVAHFFLAYFVSLPRLWKMMLSRPGEHWFAFCVVMLVTLTLFFCFAWFREQFCIVLCPYGRIQSALTDEHTLTVAYDRGRGEPRGRPGATGVGDCVNCLRCVQVCPTGIDIRNGLQLECIGCAACLDACDAVMLRLKRRRGLVRYTSMRGLQGLKTRWLRPRILAYTGLLAAGLAALGFSITRLHSFQATLTRLAGAPYYVTAEGVRNQFQLELVNKRRETGEFRLDLEDAPAGTRLNPSGNAIRVPGQEEYKGVLTIEIPRSVYQGKQRLVLRVRNGTHPDATALEFEFTGPDPRLLPEISPAPAPASIP